MNELFEEEVPVFVAPEIPTVEEEKAREAKDSATPDVQKILFILFKYFENN